jgi:hypothetical protein
LRFRWAACQLDILEKCPDLLKLRESLRSLPKTLEETYGRILAGIDENYRDYAIRILQFLAYSEQPLAIEEAVDALAVDPSGETPFDPELRMPQPQDIMKKCSSLVTLTIRPNDHDTGQSMILQLAHFSIQQYLKSGRIIATFPGHIEVGELFQNGMDETNARGSMTKLCLTYLSYLPRESPCEQILLDFPLSIYAARYWLDHAKLGATLNDVQRAILTFFGRREAFRVWGRLVHPKYLGSVRRQDQKLAPPLY